MSTDTYNRDLIEVGDLIRRKREEKNMTQCNLAEKSGIYEKSISHLELGRNMKLSAFLTLAEALGVTSNDISPSRLTIGVKDEEVMRLESRILSLSQNHKAMVCGMINSIIDNVLKYG